MKDTESDELIPGLDSIVKNISGHLLPLAAQRLGTDHRSFAGRLLGAKAIPMREVNASTSSLDGWNTFEVCLNVGLMLFLWKVIKLFVFGITPLNEKDDATELHMRFLTMATKAESLMKAFWTNDFLELSTFKIEDLDENQSRLAGYQIYFAEHFIFGHELGHVVLNCSDQEKILKGIVAVLHRDGFGQSVDMKTLQEWACEIRADQLGLDLLLSHVEEIGEPKFDKSSPL